MQTIPLSHLISTAEDQVGKCMIIKHQFRTLFYLIAA